MSDRRYLPLMNSLLALSLSAGLLVPVVAHGTAALFEATDGPAVLGKLLGVVASAALMAIGYGFARWVERYRNTPPQ